MTITATPFLRNALLLDATVSGAASLLLMTGAAPLAPLLGLPQPLLFWAGAVMVPFVALLVILSRLGTVSRMLLIDVIGLNVLWVAASIGLVVLAPVQPTAFGVAFVLAQAAAVSLFAALQWIGMRRAQVSPAA